MIAAFVPIWLLAGAGYAARRLRLLRDGAAAVLAWFVFHVAMPAAIFRTLDAMTLARIDGRPLIAFAASTAAALAAGWYAAGRWFGRKPAERAISGMAGGYVNSANLGIPIAMQVLGGISFLIQIVLVQVLIVSPVILTVLDRHADGGTGRIRVLRLLTLPVRNPVIGASALGIACSAAGFRPPALLAVPLAALAAAAVPAALIALGASLHRDEPAPPAGRAEITVIAALKLIGQPAIAWAIGALALGLPPAQLLAVVVCAALPTAQNAFVYARQYGVAEALASRAVLVTTTVSLGTIAATAALVGR